MRNNRRACAKRNNDIEGTTNGERNGNSWKTNNRHKCSRSWRQLTSCKQWIPWCHFGFEPCTEQSLHILSLIFNGSNRFSQLIECYSNAFNRSKTALLNYWFHLNFVSFWLWVHSSSGSNARSMNASCIHCISCDWDSKPERSLISDFQA